MTKETKASRLARFTLGPDDEAPPLPPEALSARRGAAPVRMVALEHVERELESTKTQLETLRRTGGLQLLPLDELHIRDDWRRQLSPDEYESLRENLRSNPLDTPITVRPRPEGGYEVISGSNRVAIYRELGRTEIEGVIRHVDDAEAEARAVYSNLLAVTLPDYEKHLALLRLMKRHGLSQAAVAQQAGISPSLVSRLMSFADLPVGVHETLRTRPHILGANAASALATLVAQGRAEAVEQAVAGLAEGTIASEKEALAAARSATTPKPPKPAPSRVSYKRGRQKFAELTWVGRTLRVDFASDSMVDEALVDEIRNLIARRASNADTQA